MRALSAVVLTALGIAAAAAPDLAALSVMSGYRIPSTREEVDMETAVNAAIAECIRTNAEAMAAAVVQEGLPQAQVLLADERLMDVGAGDLWIGPLDLAVLARSIQLPTQPPAGFTESLQRTLLDALPTLPADIIKLVISYTSLQVQLPLLVTPCVGRQYPDSVGFSTVTSESVSLLQRGFVMRVLVCYGGPFVNGVSVEYGPSSLFSDPSGFLQSEIAYGRNDRPYKQPLFLHVDEFVLGVEFFVGQYGDSLRFETSEGRTFRVGRSSGGVRIAFRAPANTALVGLRGAIGGHLHSIGCVWASLGGYRDQQEQEQLSEGAGQQAAAVAAP